MAANLSFGAWLRQKRREVGLTQEILGDLAGYSGVYSRKIEAGERLPSRQVVEQLLDVLRVPRTACPPYLQLVHSPAPVLPLQTTPRTNLPIPPTPLIGRETELAAVEALLRRDTVRLVTLTGLGGTGKTRLALEVAARLLADFQQRVYFVDLAPLSDPALVVAAIAQVLDVRAQGARPLLDLLKDYLRDKHLLLVLDNFERVIEAATVVAELLAGAAPLKALVTSRERLRLRGEYTVVVPPLAVPALHPLPPLAELAQVEAVRLFAERAEAVKAGFQVNAENAQAVAAICQRLDGLPLAIELAAARLAVLPPHAILDRLDGGLTLLASGPRDAPDRQKTLSGTIGWSYDLLSQAEQRLFRRLGVFVGGWTLAAAEAVMPAAPPDGAGRFDVLEGLTSLVDKSLVQPREAEDEARFTMLETIREYALERLAECGELSAARQQHAHFFLTLAEATAPDLQGPHALAVLNRLERDHDNLRAALAWYQTADDGAGPGLRLASALGWFWEMHGDYSEGRRWLEAALARATDAPAEQRAVALVNLASLTWHCGDHALSEQHTWACLALQSELGDHPALAAALLWLGVAARQGGHLDEALAFCEASLAMSRRLADKLTTAWALRNIGNISKRRGDYATARRWLEESLALQREMGDQLDIAALLHNLGEIATYEGDYARARSLLDEATVLYEQMRARLGLAWNLRSLARVAYAQRDYPRAAALLRDSLRLFVELGNPRDGVICLQGLAEVYAAQGRALAVARLQGAVAAHGEVIEVDLLAGKEVHFADGSEPPAAAVTKEQLAAARAEGRAMTLHQAMAYALEPRVDDET